MRQLAQLHLKDGEPLNDYFMPAQELYSKLRQLGEKQETSKQNVSKGTVHSVQYAKENGLVAQEYKRKQIFHAC